MKYIDKDHTIIQDGNRSIPCNLNNRHYKQIVDDGLLDKVEPYVEPEKTYQELRSAEYPSIQDQFDDIYHNGIDGWKATIKKVKDKYPKTK